MSMDQSRNQRVTGQAVTEMGAEAVVRAVRADGRLEIIEDMRTSTTTDQDTRDMLALDTSLPF